jgi:hypothetical protein
MAIDMGVNRSFSQLLRSGMGKGKTPEELEEERHLVVHSRVWFYVSVTSADIADDSSISWSISGYLCGMRLTIQNGVRHGTTSDIAGRRNDTQLPSTAGTSIVNHLGCEARLDRRVDGVAR